MNTASPTVWKVPVDQVGIDTCEESRIGSMGQVGAVSNVDIIASNPAERDLSGWQGNVIGDRPSWRISDAGAGRAPQSYKP